MSQQPKPTDKCQHSNCGKQKQNHFRYSDFDDDAERVYCHHRARRDLDINQTFLASTEGSDRYAPKLNHENGPVAPPTVKERDDDYAIAVSICDGRVSMSLADYQKLNNFIGELSKQNLRVEAVEGERKPDSAPIADGVPNPIKDLSEVFPSQPPETIATNTVGVPVGEHKAPEEQRWPIMEAERELQRIFKEHPEYIDGTADHFGQQVKTSKYGGGWRGCYSWLDKTFDITGATQQVAALLREVEQLKKFKAYVHQRLDDAGIEKEPNGEHSKHGCRIGDRLDMVLKLSDSKQEEPRGCTDGRGCSGPCFPECPEERQESQEELWIEAVRIFLRHDVKAAVADLKQTFSITRKSTDTL